MNPDWTPDTNPDRATEPVPRPTIRLQTEAVSEKQQMLWETIIPNAITGEASRSIDTLQLPMDSDAFAGFYERSARSLWAYLARVSGDPSLADDLMQESYVRFLSTARPPRMEDGEVASRRYLFRIATNLLRHHWRRPHATSIEEIPEELFASRSDAGHSDSLAVLVPAMARMKQRERQLLWLAHAEGYTHHEIAEVTGLASASIRLLLFRARRKIARLLRDQQEQKSRLEVNCGRES
jgi:RNA polymerase sigma-70 factor (ECF subfamily)